MKYQYILLVFLLIIVSGCVGTQGEQVNNTSSVSENIYYLDCNFTPEGKIGNHVVPEGYVFIVWDIYLQNNGTAPINTNPAQWTLIVDGVEHSTHRTTHSDEIAHDTVKIYPGADYETQFVYLVKIDEFSKACVDRTVEIVYTGSQPFEFRQTEYYTSGPLGL
jgi:hypothetical protein